MTKREMFSPALEKELKRRGAERLAAAIREHPAGHGREGRVEAHWFTVHRKKVVRWMDGLAPLPSGFFVRIDPEGRGEAYRVVFPERWRELQFLRDYRFLRRVGAVPPLGHIKLIREVDRELRMGVVLTWDNEYFLCTPIGVFRIPWQATRCLGEAVSAVLGGEGNPLRSGASWEELEPLFLEAALLRL